MAPRAIRKVVAAEGALVVVTGHATPRARGRVVMERDGRDDLSPARGPRPDAVAIGTAQAPACVSGVAEVDAVGARPLRRSRVTAERVARPARREVSARRLRAG